MTAPQLLALYDPLPLAIRFHIRGRWRLFPFPSLMKYVSPDGRLLDIGCGYGLWCFYVGICFPRISILGVDPDKDKVEVAHAIARRHALDQIRFSVGSVENVGKEEFATISIIDVMYLIPHQQQLEMISRAWELLQPGGRILIKEMGYHPGWKFAWNWLEEFLAVRLLNITLGNQFYFRKESEWLNILHLQGFAAQMIRMDSGFLHPHVLFIGEKT